MQVKRYLSASVLAFAFMFVFEWLFHGVCLKGLYEATQSLWRPEEEMLMGIMTLSQVLFALIFGLLYVRGGEDQNCCSGVKLGLLVGLLFIPLNLTWYAVQPIPFQLIILWCVGSLLECALIGLLWSKVYTCGSSDA